MSSSSDAATAHLIDMGFTASQASTALSKNDNNLDHAVEWLFSPAGQAEIAAAAAASLQAQSSAVRTPAQSSPRRQHERQVQQNNQQQQRVPGKLYLPASVAAAAGVGVPLPRVTPTIPHSAPPQPQPQPQPQPRFAGSVHPAGGPVAASPHTSASATAARPSASAAVAAAGRVRIDDIHVPRGFYRGAVKRFVCKPAENKYFGFIQPLDEQLKFFGNIYFHYKAQLAKAYTIEMFERGEAVQRAGENEPPLSTGDIIAFRLGSRKYPYAPYVPEEAERAVSKVPQGELVALDIFVLQYSNKPPPHMRRTIAQIAAGENAGGVKMDAATAAAASSASGKDDYLLNHNVPSFPINELIGKRLKGVVLRLSDTSRIGFLAMHHISNATLLFRYADFLECKQAGRSSSRPPRLVVGDVLEYTLVDTPLRADNIRIVATETYAKERYEREKKQEVDMRASGLDRDSIRAHTPQAQLFHLMNDNVPPLFIYGTTIEADESRCLEFKSLTRSKSIGSLRDTMMELAEKYLNSFLNSSGGTILFGIEDNGLVRGLSVDKKERDYIRLTIDNYLKHFTPSVEPHYCTIQFIPVYALYKSSWCMSDASSVAAAAVAAGADDGVCSLGKYISEDNEPADTIEHMLTPEDNDRVERYQQNNQDMTVVAICIAKGDPSVVLYETSGKGDKKAAFVRRDGGLQVCTPAMIQQRVESRMSASTERKQAELAEQIRSLQEKVASGHAAAPAAVAAANAGLTVEAMAAAVMQILKKQGVVSEAHQQQAIADVAQAVMSGSSAAHVPPPATAATAAAAAPSPASERGKPLPSPAASAPPSSAQSTLVSPSPSRAESEARAAAFAMFPALSAAPLSASSAAPSASPAAASVSPSAGVSTVAPPALIAALEQMQFSRASIIDAVAKLSRSGRIDFTGVLQPGSNPARDVELVDAVVEELLSGLMNSPAPPTETVASHSHSAAAASAPSLSPSSAAVSSSPAVSSSGRRTDAYAPAGANVMSDIEGEGYVHVNASPRTTAASLAGEGEAATWQAYAPSTVNSAHFASASSSVPAASLAHTPSASAPSPSPHSSLRAGRQPQLPAEACYQAAPSAPAAPAAGDIQEGAEEVLPCEFCSRLITITHFSDHQTKCRQAHE